ncbi:hypothetical protein HYX05_03445 [Candidatus Woesearchaeota archaeon]|nr:hypothetical protein [Candidatus Woesearchaeota archaeon]
MNVKEFFRPNKLKIIVMIVFLVMSIAFLVVVTGCKVTTSPTCSVLEILFAMFNLFLWLLLLTPLSIAPLAGTPLAIISGVCATLSYDYILACLFSYLMEKIKARK